MENDEAELRGIARLLMHRVIDYVAVANGLAPPQFGVDHALLGAFFSVAENDFPLAELERHGIPLHGISILEGREIHRLCYLQKHTPESQSLAVALINRPPSENQGEFVQIWKMTLADEDKCPSQWSIKYPLDNDNGHALLKTIYNALFGSGLRDMDSAMAGILANVLGPATITLCDSVPLPPITPPVPSVNNSDPPPPNDDATVEENYLELDDEDDCGAETGYFNPDDYSNLGPIGLDLRNMDKVYDMVEAAKADPRWSRMVEDFDLVESDPGARERILDVVRASNTKKKVSHLAFESYVLRHWSSQPHEKIGRHKPKACCETGVRILAPAYINRGRRMSTTNVRGVYQPW
jgi:hypothetical protein